MDNIEFMRGFHETTLPGEEFRHRGHLRLSWLVLSKHDLPEAIQLVSKGIREFAMAKGASNMYHETMTRFWLRLVNHTLTHTGKKIGFEELLERFPLLLNKQLPYKHWTPRLLMSKEARQEWVEPDLLSLPF